MPPQTIKGASEADCISGDGPEVVFQEARVAYRATGLKVQAASLHLAT